MSSYELTIGLRYTRAKRRNHFISFISLISMGGMALGVAALIVVLSVMNGFQEELRSRILASISHVEIRASGSGGLADWKAVAGQVSGQPQVIGVAPYVEGQGLLAVGENVRGVLVRGVDPTLENTVADFDKHMKRGRFDELRAGEFGIILGADLAARLNIGVGERVMLVTPQAQITPIGAMPRMKQFRLVGIFEFGLNDADGTLALINIADAQKIYQLGDAVSGVRLKLDDLFAAPRVARELAGKLRVDAQLRDWTMMNANFFRAVALEKKMMFIILTLIVAVAAFNIVSTLVMVVTDKQADIAILRTLGAPPSSIMKIFMVQGVLIGVIGTVLGVMGGTLLASNLDTVVPALERLLGTRLWDKNVYLISELPSKIEPSDVLMVTIVSFVLSIVATVYPSWRASRVQPAEALRYE
ncbi:MAG: lipoprotein-releasing ABC transporter permease subunit [Betaproteobacteria bacterium]|nr:lipoprotein-releasing ABC transporter permease subunit [Betaproteobacteria bacterium]